jgi:hypothetical protein
LGPRAPEERRVFRASQGDLVILEVQVLKVSQVLRWLRRVIQEPEVRMETPVSPDSQVTPEGPDRLVSPGDQEPKVNQDFLVSACPGLLVPKVSQVLLARPDLPAEQDGQDWTVSLVRLDSQDPRVSLV